MEDELQHGMMVHGLSTLVMETEHPTVALETGLLLGLLGPKLQLTVFSKIPLLQALRLQHMVGAVILGALRLQHTNTQAHPTITGAPTSQRLTDGDPIHMMRQPQALTRLPPQELALLPHPAQPQVLIPPRHQAPTTLPPPLP